MLTALSFEITLNIFSRIEYVQDQYSFLRSSRVLYQQCIAKWNHDTEGGKEAGLHYYVAANSFAFKKWFNSSNEAHHLYLQTLTKRNGIGELWKLNKIFSPLKSATLLSFNVAFKTVALPFLQRLEDEPSTPLPRDDEPPWPEDVKRVTWIINPTRTMCNYLIYCHWYGMNFFPVQRSWKWGAVSDGDVLAYLDQCTHPSGSRPDFEDIMSPSHKSHYHDIHDMMLMLDFMLLRPAPILDVLERRLRVLLTGTMLSYGEETTIVRELEFLERQRQSKSACNNLGQDGFLLLYILSNAVDLASPPSPSPSPASSSSSSSCLPLSSSSSISSPSASQNDMLAIIEDYDPHYTYLAAVRLNEGRHSDPEALDFPRRHLDGPVGNRGFTLPTHWLREDICTLVSRRNTGWRSWIGYRWQERDIQDEWYHKVSREAFKKVDGSSAGRCYRWQCGLCPKVATDE